MNRQLFPFVLCLASFAHPNVLAAGEVDCLIPGRNSPAVPVPECVDSQGFKVDCSTAGSIRLWPEGFRPASGIPRLRDSTDRVAGKTVPGQRSGHELFSGLDVVTVDGVSRRLYVSYNAGVQVWDIDGTLARKPRRLTVADGWESDFLHFPPPDEVLSYITDVAASNEGPDSDVVAVAGKPPVGTSLWQFQMSLRKFKPIYQDQATDAKQIRMAETSGGVLYAFAGGGDGLAVYNVTAARGLQEPCLDAQGSKCPTVFRGFVGDTAGKTKIFIDTLQLPGSDRVFVSASGGLFSDLELWQVHDPQNPATAVRRFSGLKHALGTALFFYDGHAYLAVVSEENGLNKELLRIFRVDDCLDGSAPCAIGAGSMEEVVQPTSLEGYPTAKDYLTYSETFGKPYLYYGASTGSLSGPDLERLFDLSPLRPLDGAPLESLPEVTETGGFYKDPCNEAEIRYWSHYYHSNTHGLNNTVPRAGKFSTTGHFYRVSSSILDVHVLEGKAEEPEQPAAIFADDFESGGMGAWTRSPPPPAAAAPTNGTL